MFVIVQQQTDDFVVPEGAVWTITKAQLRGFIPGSQVTNLLGNLVLEIYDNGVQNNPFNQSQNINVPGSLLSRTFTPNGIEMLQLSKLFGLGLPPNTTLAATQELDIVATLQTPLILVPGRYWLSGFIVTAATGTSTWNIYSRDKNITIIGESLQARQNQLIFNFPYYPSLYLTSSCRVSPSVNIWIPSVGQELFFIIFGSSAAFNESTAPSSPSNTPSDVNSNLLALLVLPGVVIIAVVVVLIVLWRKKHQRFLRSDSGVGIELLSPYLKNVEINGVIGSGNFGIGLVLLLIHNEQELCMKENGKIHQVQKHWHCADL